MGPVIKKEYLHMQRAAKPMTCAVAANYTYKQLKNEKSIKQWQKI